MKVIDCTQGTPEWHFARAGRVTASRIADMMAKTKSGWGASRANYMAELVAERLTGTVAESFTNAAMKHGTETEPEARAAYQFFTDQTVAEIGFVIHPSLDASGCSPDGLVGDLGLIEIKAPNTSTHIETLLQEKIPERYFLQIQWQLACTDRAYCDYVSYDPRLPARMQMFIQRVDRSDVVIKGLESDVRAFLGELDAKVLALTNKFGLPVAA